MASTPEFAGIVAAQRRPGRESNDGTLDLKELVRLGTLAASSQNTQPWQFQLQERSKTNRAVVGVERINDDKKRRTTKKKGSEAEDLKKKKLRLTRATG
jgi:hypothetical protein